jgi:signal transduction histidine kinase
MTSTSTDGGSGPAAVSSSPMALARVGAAVGALWSASRRVLARPDGPIAAAVLLAGVGLVEASVYYPDSRREVAILLSLGATLPLALAPRLPALTGAVITAVTLITASQRDAMITVAGVVALLAAVYLVARHRPRWVSVVLALPFVVNAITPFGGDDAVVSGVVLLVLVMAAQALGVAEDRRGAAVAERDAVRLAMAETLREQAVMEERARIAHELHDIVAHHISMISVQAERARLTTPGMPEAGRTQLAAIGDTARGALDEMRRLLGVLRDGEGGAAAARMPQPGLDQLDELVDAARSAGSTVRLAIQGPARSLPPSVDLAAYRIVQESLTNARRHAPGATVTVDIAYGRDAVSVRVRDDGAATAGADTPEPGAGSAAGPSGGQLGLAGLSERVALAGGTFRAGPSDGGGFLVSAELPVPPTETRPPAASPEGSGR